MLGEIIVRNRSSSHCDAATTPPPPQSIQFNEDDGDEMMADVIWRAMIDGGDDCNDM